MSGSTEKLTKSASGTVLHLARLVARGAVGRIEVDVLALVGRLEGCGELVEARLRHGVGEQVDRAGATVAGGAVTTPRCRSSHHCTL